ncbi:MULTISPECIES: LegC family aminotransferase [unclassified Sphingobacterium]|uniref:LegC family aminotransferase n=1 Tax=unclassified Sphingobacterium TaxID=2609468 RepID=UPI00104FA682|nr:MULTISPECIES: LegC family aminotransferase [unclassified Sphingobacterium]MCS3555833.1 aminotransferase in exopolysaccharide biosynthesis [Sphingobacterium sp. JUb21]TCR00714.1 aminotransferase in exopolysaccharide biosynthesis [Sphingobacterium sp. JUb20]
MEKISQLISFVRDQYKTDKFIPLHEPRFRGNEKKYVLDTIDSTFVSSVGAYVDQFEVMMQEVTQTSKAIAVVNGTSSLQVALRLSGVSAGDEVITQALTFIATANAIVYNQATPIFIDVDLDTMGLSPTAVAAFLEEFGELREGGCYNKLTGKRIAACMPMHTFGFPVHLDELLAICNKWQIPVVEDAAESLGSYYKGKHTGSMGLISGFSFNGNKTITSGGGGVIVTNDIEIGKHAKYLTTTAKRPHPYEFFHDELGYNFRMPNLNAALACAQLEELGGFLADKRDLATAYSALFQELGIKFREELPESKANYWLMCVELNNKAEREDFLKYTNEAGIMTRPIWNLMYRLPMYTHCQRDAQKNAEFLEERIVNIPSSVR